MTVSSTPGDRAACTGVVGVEREGDLGGTASLPDRVLEPISRSCCDNIRLLSVFDDISVGLDYSLLNRNYSA